MAVALTPDVLQDDLAVSLARGIAAANRRARELGVDVTKSLISVIQQDSGKSSVWRINYGPKHYVNRRGGDVLIEVDTADATIKRVLSGQ